MSRFRQGLTNKEPEGEEPSEVSNTVHLSLKLAHHGHPFGVGSRLDMAGMALLPE